MLRICKKTFISREWLISLVLHQLILSPIYFIVTFPPPTLPSCASPALDRPIVAPTQILIFLCQKKMVLAALFGSACRVDICLCLLPWSRTCTQQKYTSPKLGIFCSDGEDRKSLMGGKQLIRELGRTKSMYTGRDVRLVMLRKKIYWLQFGYFVCRRASPAFTWLNKGYIYL